MRVPCLPAGLPTITRRLDDEQRVQLPGDPAGSDAGQHVRRVRVHAVHGPAGGVRPVTVRHRGPVRPAVDTCAAGQGIRLHRSGRRFGGQRGGQPT